MAKETFKLTAAEDQATGGIGIKFDDMQDFSYSSGEPTMAMEGYLLAHDLMAHQNGLASIGGVGEECEASGGDWYIRGQHGQYSKNGGDYRSAFEMFTSQLVNDGIRFFNGADWGRTIPTDTESDYDETFEEAIEEARKGIFAEASHYQEGDNNEVFEKAQEYLSKVIYFLRAGINKAQERFPDENHAWTLFWNIADALDPLAKSPQFEGEEYELIVDWEEGTAEAHEVIYNYCEKCYMDDVEEEDFNFSHNMCNECADDTFAECKECEDDKEKENMTNGICEDCHIEDSETVKDGCIISF